MDQLIVKSGFPLASPLHRPSRFAPRVQMSGHERVLAHLRRRIERIERTAPLLHCREGAACDHAAPPWTLGSPEVDARLGQEGLLLAGVHEVKPAPPAESGSWAASQAAALAFALALSARRSLLPDVRAAAPILCCRPASIAGELGSFYAPGLRALGIDPARLIFAEPAKAADVLWAMEEGLKSGAAALVIGIMEDVALTPARRLSLASALERTPCLLLTHARSEAAAATATRWRVKPFPAAPNRFDARAPGVLTLVVELERCRSCPASSAAVGFVVEWCDETRSFRLVSRLADRSDAARGSARSAR